MTKPKGSTNEVSESDITFKQHKFDIHVKEITKVKSDGLNQSRITLQFSGSDSNIKIINALRRICLNNVPSYAIPPECINITKNTTVAFNNCYMKVRLASLPVQNIDCGLYYLDEKYWNVNYADQNRDKHPDEINVEYYINAKNDTTEIINVTTNDIVTTVDGTNQKLYSEKYPILLIQLRSGDEFKCHMKATLGIGESDTRWCAARNAYHDDESSDETTQRFNLTIEGNNQSNEYEILIRACKYIIKKMREMKNDLEEKIKKKQILPNKQIYFELQNESHTIGEILNHQFQDNKNILASGLSKPDHLVKAMLIKVTSVPNVASPLDAMLESITTIENKLSHIGYLISKIKS